MGLLKENANQRKHLLEWNCDHQKQQARHFAIRVEITLGAAGSRILGMSGDARGSSGPHPRRHWRRIWRKLKMQTTRRRAHSRQRPARTFAQCGAGAAATGSRIAHPARSLGSRGPERRPPRAAAARTVRQRAIQDSTQWN